MKTYYFARDNGDVVTQDMSDSCYSEIYSGTRWKDSREKAISETRKSLLFLVDDAISVLREYKKKLSDFEESVNNSRVKAETTAQSPPSLSVCPNCTEPNILLKTGLPGDKMQLCCSRCGLSSALTSTEPDAYRCWNSMQVLKR
jgi:hypothetical protein